MKRAKSSSLKYNENHHNQHNTEEDEQMAKLNITLNQEEILQLLSKDHDQAFRELLRRELVDSQGMQGIPRRHRHPRENQFTHKFGLDF